LVVPGSRGKSPKQELRAWGVHWRRVNQSGTPRPCWVNTAAATRVHHWLWWPCRQGHVLSGAQVLDKEPEAEELRAQGGALARRWPELAQTILARCTLCEQQHVSTVDGN